MKWINSLELKLLTLNQNIENLSRTYQRDSVTNQKTPVKESPGPDDCPVGFDQTFKGLTPVK